MEVEVYSSVEEIEIKNNKYFILITEEFVKDIPKLRKKLKDVEFKGAIVPYLIFQKNLINKGIILISFKNFEMVIVSMKQLNCKIYKSNSIYCFVDGLSAYMESFFEEINSQIGDDTIVFGGGVGYKNFEHKEVIFDKENFYKDHAVLIYTNVKTIIDYAHGWKPLYGPFVVTKVDKNILYELNGENAFNVYKETLKKFANIEVNENNFSEISKSYPFGIFNFSDENFIIRDPIKIYDKNAIQIVSSVKEMDTLYIMSGNKNDLINSACALSRRVFKSITKVNNALLLDCISRVIFLENRFEEEIQNIYKCAEIKNINLVGFTTIGEITNYGYDNIKVLNKTTLLGALIES